MITKVRIAVVVDKDGAWAAYGVDRYVDTKLMSEASEILGSDGTKYWITAELNIPEHVPGQVEKA